MHDPVSLNMNCVGDQTVTRIEKSIVKQTKNCVGLLRNSAQLKNKFVNSEVIGITKIPRHTFGEKPTS